MTDLMELAKECEAAVGPDRSLDGLIAHAIGCSMPDDPAGWPPRYTASLDAALTLVPEGYWWHVGHGRLTEGEPLGGASIVEPGNEEDSLSEAEAATSILALCAAALYARAALADQSS